MNARFVISTIVAVCLTGAAGCTSDSRSTPLAPTPSTPPRAPTPPPPPRPLAVDLTGDYALTFEVGNACEQIPQELKTRTYAVTIEYESSYESTDLFLAELRGATFHNQLPVWIEVTGGASGHTVWLDLALSDNVILEEPERGTYFMVAGGDGMASVDPAAPSTISTSFTGHFNYCVETSEIGSQNDCSPDAMRHSLCKSANSRWTLTRR